MSKLLTTKETAEYLKVHEDTLTRWVRKQKIPVVLLPSGDFRFDEKQIENWIKANTIKSVA